MSSRGRPPRELSLPPHGEMARHDVDALRLQLGEDQAQGGSSTYAWAFANSQRMRAVREMIERVATTDVTVLIWGESGVGKELVAEGLHRESPRRERPFLKVNCAALPEELLESELFGYERGAFTGAHGTKPGKFELADTGTMFLDEVGEIPLELQAKLLQVLQDGQFSRLGGQRDIRVDVRVITATNRNLVQLVERGVFREDLYYRLNVVSIHVPPLRERREEIPILIEECLRRYSEQYGRPRQHISAETLRRFMDYSWPGNIRELENTIKRMVVLGSEEWNDPDPVAQPIDSSSRLESGSPPSKTPPVAGEIILDGRGLKEIAREAAREAERTALRLVLNRVHWNRREAARRLKISHKTLLSKIKTLL